MSELGSGTEKKLLADANAQQNGQNNIKLQYVTDDKINNSSAKEVYFRWLSRFGSVFECFTGYFSPIAGDYRGTAFDYQSK